MLNAITDQDGELHLRCVVPLRIIFGPRNRTWFRIGYPGCEFQIREALAEAIGVEKAALFFEKVGNTTGKDL